jgi:hypothetical protein
MRSQGFYWAAQGLRGLKVVLARPTVPPIASSLQHIYGKRMTLRHMQPVLII